MLHRASDATLDQLAANGLREVALGVESGNARVLHYIAKRITPDMIRTVIRRLGERGIAVKGYFILGFPAESPDELADTVRLVRELWHLTDRLPGRFRASVEEAQQAGEPKSVDVVSEVSATDLATSGDLPKIIKFP